MTREEAIAKSNVGTARRETYDAVWLASKGGIFAFPANSEYAAVLPLDGPELKDWEPVMLNLFDRMRDWVEQKFERWKNSRAGA